MTDQPVAAKRIRMKPRWLVGLILAVFVLGLLLVRPSATKAPNLKWLTPAEFAGSVRPGRLLRLKWQIQNIIGRYWPRIWSNRASILIQSYILTVPAEAAEKSALPAPLTTNSAGMCAWILPKKSFGANPATLVPFAKLEAGPQIQTGDEMQARIFQGESLPAQRIVLPDGAGASASNPIQVGVTMDIHPKIVSHAIRLTLIALATEEAGWDTSGTLLIKTNFSTACQAVIPHGGALVLRGGKPKVARESSYWLIIRPTAVDSRGNPLKL